MTDSQATRKGGNAEAIYPEFGRLVRQALGRSDEPGAAGELTGREAARITGISLGTINSMARGVRPKASILLSFANALDLSAAALMAAAGYQAPDAVAASDPDEAQIIARYRALPADKKQDARKYLRRLGGEFDGNDEGEGDPPPVSASRS